MASTYDELGTEVMATGENINTWGTKLNEAKALLIEAIKGVASAAITDAGLTLTIPQNTPGLGRKALVKIDGAALTAPGNVTVPAIQKTWFFHYFGSAQPLLITAGGAPVTVRPNSFALVYCDGVDVFNPEASLDRIKPPAAAVDFNGQKATNLANGSSPTDAATVGQIAAIVVPYAQAAANSAVAADSSASSAVGAAGAASAYADAAGGSAGVAADSAGAALAYKSKASEWADKPEDSPVETGPDRFSAFHWSQKAQGWASSVNLPAIQPGDAGKALIVNPAETGYLFGSPKDFTRIIRTSNVQIGAANLGQFIDITAGTFTQTFAAVADLPDGWFCYLRNSGSGDVTLDPNGSEQIDGLTSYIMYPGEMRLIFKDGTALRSVVMTAFAKTFTTSGNFIKPPGYALFWGEMWGGGGGGGSGNGSGATLGGGGSGAPCVEVSVPASKLAASESVTIGSGGAGSAGEGNGTSGGASAFAGFTAPPGLGGSGTFPTAPGGAAVSSPTNSAPFFLGTAGGGSGSPGISSSKGASGGGGSPNTNATTAGGISAFAGNGGQGVGNGASAGAINGTAPGAGGGGRYSGLAGAGARGELRIWGVI